MKCPTCTSDNTQRLEVLYKTGTQNIATTSNSAGAAIGGGGFGFGSVRTSTSGTSQSILANQAAPPAKQSLKAPIIMIIVGLFILAGMKGWIMTLCGYVFIGLGGLSVYSAIDFNKNKWPYKFQRWKDSWVCHKCGTVYID